MAIQTPRPVADKVSTINLYGDTMIATTGVHGADIASQREDELDRLCLEFALAGDRAKSFAIDLGCGSGIQGIRLARSGIETLLIEQMDIRPAIDAISKTDSTLNIHCLIKDARSIRSDDFAKPANIIFSQRFIHYLSYSEAGRLLSTMARVAAHNGQFFFSASGLHSELADGYPDRTEKIAQRYAYLHPKMAEKHHIRQKVCLYTEQEMVRLAASCGLSTIKIWSSQFGNIKAVFEKP